MVHPSVVGAVAAPLATAGADQAVVERPKRRNVGGHWPTKIAQSSLSASLSIAEMPIEPRAAQYHASSGTLSVMRKNVYCASAACSFGSTIMQLLSHSHCVVSEWAHLP